MQRRGDELLRTLYRGTISEHNKERMDMGKMD